MEAVTVSALTTIAGLALITGLVLGVVSRALDWSGQTMDRFGALISILIAVVFAILATLALGIFSGVDLLQAVLNGIVAGLTASGGYDLLNGANKARTDS